MKGDFLCGLCALAGDIPILLVAASPRCASAVNIRNLLDCAPEICAGYKKQFWQMVDSFCFAVISEAKKERLLR
jgi:hypothetical protein